MLHLLAIAHEVGFDLIFDISFANEISEKTPNLCHLAPAGPTYIWKTLMKRCGVYAVMNEIKRLGLLHVDLHDCKRNMHVSLEKILKIVKTRIHRLSDLLLTTHSNKTGGLAV